jgi:hypothetical protein
MGPARARIREVVMIVSGQLGVDLWDRWTALWNGDLALGPDILAADFRIHFGNVIEDADTDSFRGPADLTAFIGAFRRRYRRLRYRTGVGPIVDIPAVDGVPAGHVACRWLADAIDGTGTPTTKAGIDILRIAGDRIVEVWSVTGSRLLGAAG